MKNRISEIQNNQDVDEKTIVPSENLLNETKGLSHKVRNCQKVSFSIRLFLLSLVKKWRLSWLTSNVGLRRIKIMLKQVEYFFLNFLTVSCSVFDPWAEHLESSYQVPKV